MTVLVIKSIFVAQLLNATNMENLDENSQSDMVAESGMVYSVKNHTSGQLYIDPLLDWAFKKIFASETSKEVAIAFLNVVLEGKRQINTITYGKTIIQVILKMKQVAFSISFVLILMAQHFWSKYKNSGRNILKNVRCFMPAD